MAGDPDLKTARWKRLREECKREMAPVCWRCGNDIDMSLPGNHKWGWTLDHVLPRWEHPELKFVKSNLKPAHHDCNSKGISPKQSNSSRHYG